MSEYLVCLTMLQSHSENFQFTAKMTYSLKASNKLKKKFPFKIADKKEWSKMGREAKCAN